MTYLIEIQASYKDEKEKFSVQRLAEMKKGFVPINHIVDIQTFSYWEYDAALMAEAAVGPVGKRWAGSGVSSDAWTPGSSWVDQSSGTLGG